MVAETTSDPLPAYSKGESPECDPGQVQHQDADHATLKYSLLGPSLTKAGQDSVDQSKVTSHPACLTEPNTNLIFLTPIQGLRDHLQCLQRLQIF